MLNLMQKAILKSLSIFILTIYGLSTISWMIGVFHYYTCTPLTAWGWVLSPLKMGSPVCQFMNYIQYELGKYYVALWISSGASLIAYFK